MIHHVEPYATPRVTCNHCWSEFTTDWKHIRADFLEENRFTVECPVCKTAVLVSDVKIPPFYREQIRKAKR